ncbi:hypothetical protein T06_13736 [Trichinella sp. T6]|nr:hypothetical protein T06_13736 [Trichinella sp. T6]
MENCSFILFLWLVMQGVVDNFITLLMNMIYITIHITIYEYFAPLSDDSLLLNSCKRGSSFNLLFYSNQKKLCWLSYMKSATAR